MPKTLPLNDAVVTRVFRRVVRQLELDPDVKRVLPGASLRSWKGESGDKAPFSPSRDKPVCRLTPQPRNQAWQYADAQVLDLVIRVELAVQSLAIDDVNNLWDCIVNALRPDDEFTAALQDLGAETGQLDFSDPAYDPKPDADPEGEFHAEGQVRLRVNRTMID